MIYRDWGFRGSPFEATPLPPSDLGRRLLVGRDAEVAALMRRIESGPRLPTIEGLNGIGKTSVVNVAAYSLYQQHLEKGEVPLYIPCKKIFQLTSHTRIQDFVDGVLMEVAQTLIDRASDLTKARDKPNTAALNRWLNSPQLKTYSGGIWMVQAGNQAENNTTEGFERSGLRKIVLDWLDKLFPAREGGGIVCMIDNLELLEQSETARALLEQLRDELFNIPALRWVLCGALGIVYGVASSPRLEGYLHDPIELGEIDLKYAPSILESRIASYAETTDPYLPLLPLDFAELYSALHGNLRATLSYTESYCQHIADAAKPTSVEEKHERFKDWLDQRCEYIHSAVKGDLKPKTLEVFQFAASSLQGIFSPSDYNLFGFNSMPVFRPKIADLENSGLVVTTQDETDKRRKTIQITPKGWMVIRHLESKD